MGRNRAASDPLQTLVVGGGVTSLFAGDHVDVYMVDAPGGTPATAQTISDPAPADGDQYTVVDAGGNAVGQPITISGDSVNPLVGIGVVGNSISLNVDRGSVTITFSAGLAAWVITNTNGFGGGGGPANAFVNGGNAFGGATSLGTLDAQNLVVETAGVARMTVDQTGAILPGNGSADNAGSIGTNAHRWALVRAAVITSGDYVFEDKETGALWSQKEEPERILYCNHRTGKRYMVPLVELADGDGPPAKAFAGEAFL